MTGSLTHTGGLSVGMGYLVHSSPSTWWCQRLIHRFPGWNGTQRQAICSSLQGFGAAADETNLINIDREVGGAPHSGCAVGNEVKSKAPDKLSLVRVCAPQFSQRQKKFKRANWKIHQNWKDCLNWQAIEAANNWNNISWQTRPKHIHDIYTCPTVNFFLGTDLHVPSPKSHSSSSFWEFS